MIHDNSSQQEFDRILVGAYGWQQAPLIEHYYPADLPEDWRLSFYANEFDAVVVPAVLWLTVGEELDEWLDVPAGFRFYLEAAGEEQAQKCDEVKRQLGEHFAGLVTEMDGIDETTGVAVIDPRTRTLRGWREWLQQHGTSLRVVFLKNEQLAYKDLYEFRTLLELMNF